MDYLLLLIKFSLTLSKRESLVNMQVAMLQTDCVLEQFFSQGATTHGREPGFRRQETEGRN